MLLWILGIILISNRIVAWVLLLPIHGLTGLHLPNWLGVFVVLGLIAWCVGR